MTDCTLVKQELKSLLKLTDEEIAGYDSIIVCAANWAGSLIRNEEQENDALIVHLCAAKVFYQMSLLQNDGIASFSAGEVSYSINDNSLSGAEKLFQDALLSCSDLLTDSSFAFKAV